jgi:hypothetical protein
MLYLNRDKTVHFINPASKKQIPNISSHPISIDHLKCCISMICDMGAYWELKT